MFSIDLLFVGIVKFTLTSFLLLGVGILVLRLLKQPIERIRLIQISLASTLFALLVSQVGGLPEIRIPALPSTSNSSPTSVASHLSKSPADAAPRSVDNGALSDSGQDPAHALVASDAPFDQPAESATQQSSRSDAGTDESVAPAGFRWSFNTGWSFWSAFQTVVVVAFVAVSLGQFAYFLFGMLVTRRLISTAAPLAQKEHQAAQRLLKRFAGTTKIRILQSANVEVPIVSGVLTPTIVLPEQIASQHADPLVLEHSLAHEWKHIQRLDLFVWQLVNACQIFLWTQPFYWALRRELRVCQDQLADEYAAHKTGQHAVYAATLVEFAKARHASLSCALSMSGTKSNLYRRIEMLLSEQFQLATVSRRRVVVSFVSLMIVASLLFASLQLSRAEPAGIATSGSGATHEEGQGSQDKKDNKNQATEPVTHAGVVIDAVSKQPIDGAVVTITRTDYRSEKLTVIEATEHRTDKDGKYSFTIPPDQLNKPGLYILVDLHHDTYAPRHCGSYSYSMIKKNLQLGAPPWFSELTMVPGASVSGQLVDERGKPVAAAAIRASSEAPSDDRISGISWAETTTDDQGRFEVRLTADGPAKLSIIPVDHVMKYLDLGSDRGDLGRITLQSGVRIEGRVLDAVGKPIDGLWVNLTDLETENEASYEMKRSCQSDDQGNFDSRPLKPGRYLVEVETKATGALEKKEYANFGDVPPPAVFVRQVIEVTASTDQKPFLIQAVPHVYIKGQCYNSKGEITACHFPSLVGSVNGQGAWIEATRGKQKGAFELRVPHGIENARLSFSTNEHSALMIQTGDGPLSFQRYYELGTIEEDLEPIKVIRYVAPILQVKVLDPSGDIARNATVTLIYTEGIDPDPRLVGPPSHVFFEGQDNGLKRSVSLVPGLEFDVSAVLDGFRCEQKTLSLTEGENREITLQLTRESSEGGE